MNLPDLEKLARPVSAHCEALLQRLVRGLAPGGNADDAAAAANELGRILGLLAARAYGCDYLLENLAEADPALRQALAELNRAAPLPTIEHRKGACALAYALAMAAAPVIDGRRARSGLARALDALAEVTRGQKPRSELELDVAELRERVEYLEDSVAAFEVRADRDDAELRPWSEVCR